MTSEVYQKGRFYTLPVVDIRDEGSNSFFIVSANGREYAIRMFSFQRSSPSLGETKELPCMVKDVHGDNIVFVQNFAQMFSDRYLDGESYQFIVNKEADNSDASSRYYDIRDKNGVPFRLKCSRDTYLMPNQKVKCVVSRPSQNKMVLRLETETAQVKQQCVDAKSLLDSVGVAEPLTRYILSVFRCNSGFEEARDYMQHGNAVWVIKALMAVNGVEQWHGLDIASCKRLTECYRNVCMYLLEDTDYLLQFDAAERDDYQEWIAARVAAADTYLQCLSLIESGKDGDEVDAIFCKIRNSGYIYNPHSRMQLLIALFSMRPKLLEERIDSILDIVAKNAKDWQQPSFTDAFASFFKFYINSNRDRTLRHAVIEEAQSRVLLNRMVRSLCYYLLITGGHEHDSQLYKSLLFHFLSYARTKSVLNSADISRNLPEILVERAFNSLLLSDGGSLGIAWGQDLNNAELFAYRMANTREENTTFLTRSFEAHNVRFTVSTDGITLSRSYSAKKERNVLPDNFIEWHNIQVFLDNSSHYSISPKTKDIHKWKTYWNDIEKGLFEKRTVLSNKQMKFAPEVGTVTYVRILWQDSTNPCRFYCKIEDSAYEGNGWLDTYQRGSSIGMFHYDPKLDISSFYDDDGNPMIIKVRVNSCGSPNSENPLCVFDCMSFIDEMMKEDLEYEEESDCTIFYQDERNGTFLGVTSWGYGIFMPITEETENYVIGDSVRVRVTDSTNARAIQGEIIGLAEKPVDIGKAASNVLYDYWESTGGKHYEATDEELEEEAMAVSEDMFDTDYMTEIINILDHKAVLDADNNKAYSYLSVAHILAKMIDNENLALYIEQRQHFLCILEDYATNGKVDDRELEVIGSNDDMVEQFPLLKQRLTEMRIINSIGRSEKNEFLWNICSSYSSDHLLCKLARLMLSYNMSDGFALHDFQQAIVAKLKSLLNVNVELPKLYSFGEEDQLTEFKTSIVFPPDNGMRPDKKQQTFNIMKVICGMVNAYGGTLYLGVDDKTGIAMGLEDDLVYFENSRDKFDLYVRNNIRAAFGDKVNASIVVEYPDAGKHFVYAIKVTPSMQPVKLKMDNNYYLREGSSTYPIYLQQLQEIMVERIFDNYSTAAVDMDAIPTEETGLADDEGRHKDRKYRDEDDKIATSRMRSNVINNWEDDYLTDTVCFVRIKDIGDWCVLDGIDWEEGLLTMAVHNDEADGSLVVAYDDGHVNLVPMSQIINRSRGSINKMYADKKPMFVTPVRKDASLLTVYEDDKGKRYFRIDEVAKMPEGKMQAAGQTLTDVEFEQMIFCEIVGAEDAIKLKRLLNLRRSMLGQQLASGYFDNERSVLKKLGIDVLEI